MVVVVECVSAGYVWGGAAVVFGEAWAVVEEAGADSLQASTNDE